MSNDAESKSDGKYRVKLWKRLRGGMWHWQVFRRRDAMDSFPDEWEPGEYGTAAFKTTARWAAHAAIRGWSVRPDNSLPEEEYEWTP